jgi:hypothetical protein
LYVNINYDMRILSVTILLFIMGVTNMGTPINYLDLGGVTNLKNELDNRYVTADSVNTIVNNAIAAYKDAVVQITTAAPVYDTEGEDPTVVLGYVPNEANPQEGILYLIPDTNAETADIYEQWAWEPDADGGEGAHKWVKLGASTFTLQIDSQLDATSTNPVQNAVVTQALNTKLNTSAVESTWVDNSTNPVTSSLIKTTLDGKVDAADFVPISAEQIAALFADEEPAEPSGE